MKDALKSLRNLVANNLDLWHCSLNEFIKVIFIISFMLLLCKLTRIKSYCVLLLMSLLQCGYVKPVK